MLSYLLQRFVNMRFYGFRRYRQGCSNFSMGHTLLTAHLKYLLSYRGQIINGFGYPLL